MVSPGTGTSIPHDDSAPDDYRISLAAFQGPLDLLLYLIRRAEVDIHDIPIAAITDQFLAFVHRDAAHVDVEEAGEFLVMASALIEMKARTLAPSAPQVEGDGSGERSTAADPRAELVQALLAYQRYRRAAEEMESHRIEFWQRHAVRVAPPRAPIEPDAITDDDGASGSEADDEFTEKSGDESEIELEDAHVFDLVDAYERIAGSIDFSRLGDHRVEYDDTPIALHQEDLLDRLTRTPSHRLTLQHIFEGRTRLEMIGLFLAMLELAKQRKISIEQRDEGGAAAWTSTAARAAGAVGGEAASGTGTGVGPVEIAINEDPVDPADLVAPEVAGNAAETSGEAGDDAFVADER